jgi:hypothetical protein
VNRPFPEHSFDPGWPEYLTDNVGTEYVIMRDGSAVTDYGGNSVLYARVREDRYVDRSKFWIPALGSKPVNLEMVSGGEWMEPEEFISHDLPPTVYPEEPIEPFETEREEGDPS